MLRRMLYVCCLFVLLASIVSPTSAKSHVQNASMSHRQNALSNLPAVDPNYIYDQLFYLSTHFQHREAGYDKNLPVSNATYYDKKPLPLAWSYPFDQPQDTIQLMNTFADGSSQQSQALSLALALPGMLTTWMLNQPTVLGQAQANNEPITSINDIGSISAGRAIPFSATPAITLIGENEAATYLWNFGDGTTAQGITVRHSYSAIGNYPLTLNVTAKGKTRSILKLISVVAQPTTYSNYFTPIQFTGDPKPNPLVTLPKPNNSLTDRIIMASVSTTSPPSSRVQPKVTPELSSSSTGIIITIVVCIVLLIIGAIFFIGRRSRKRIA